MKNVTLTLATTLSVLALTFSGVASADSFDNHKSYKKHVHNHKNMIVKSSDVKFKNRHVARNKKVVKRVVVRNTPTKKVIITKTIIKKPSKTRQFVKNTRFNKVKRVSQRSTYNDRNKRYNRFNNKRAAMQFVYSVRPGDTLIQVSFKTGVSVNRLAKLNRISQANLNNLHIGQVLRLI